MARVSSYIDVRVRAQPRAVALVFITAAASGALFGLAMSLAV